MVQTLPVSLDGLGLVATRESPREVRLPAGAQLG